MRQPRGKDPLSEHDATSPDADEPESEDPVDPDFDGGEAGSKADSDWVAPDDEQPEAHGQEGDEEADAAEDEPGSVFRWIVAVLIAIVSVLGAGIAWSASSSSNTASNFDQSAQQQFLQRQQILTSARASVGEDLRRLVQFQEQIVAELTLRGQAAQQQKSSPDVAAILEQQAQGDAALARTTGALFFAAAPTVAADGTVTYNRSQALSNLLSQYVIYQQLHPAQTQASANQAVRKYRQLVAVGILFVAALFLLTVAEFARRRIRHTVVALGAAALVAGCILWPLVSAGTL